MQVPKKIGEIEVFRADSIYEDRMYDVIKSGVFKCFSPGIYREKKEITKIVNLMYKLYYQVLNEYLPKIEPRSFALFLVAQYERYGKVSDAHKSGKLSDDEDQFWRSYALSARRGMKHLLELLCISNMKSDKISSNPQEKSEAISMVFIAAEELVSLYMRSDHYMHMLDEVTLTLDPTKYVYFNVAQDDDMAFDPREGYRDAEKFISEPDFLRDIKAHSLILDEGFREKLGLTYLDTLATLEWCIETYSDANAPEETGWFRRQEVIESLTKTFSITFDQADLVLEGFSLSSQSMQREGRELFRPKQEYRAYKRPFFRDPGDGDDLIFFSRRMAKECLTLLISDVAFKKLPPEWSSKKIDQALARLSLAAGRWFERVVEDNLKKAGIIGFTSIEALHFKGGARIDIPKDVGEIDFLGFCTRQNMLVVIEVKQVGSATEPRMYLDDYSKFVVDKNNYSDKFKKKYTWVHENLKHVEKFIQEKFNNSVNISSIGYAMIIRYPTFVSTRITDFTCVSLPEFMNKYMQSDDKWIFSRTDLNAK